jgi:hypothetical protein
MSREKPKQEMEKKAANQEVGDVSYDRGLGQVRYFK